MQSKLCSSCNTIKSLDAFALNSSRKDGRQVYCRNCKKVYDANYYQANKSEQVHRNRMNRWHIQDLIYTHLQANPCIDCGESDPVVLDFDHVSGQKRMEVAVLAWRGCSKQTILAEITKCVVRCANCHRRKTAKQQGWSKHIRNQLEKLALKDDAEN